MDPFVTINEKMLREAWLRLDAVGDPGTAHTLWKHIRYALDDTEESK